MSRRISFIYKLHISFKVTLYKYQRWIPPKIEIKVYTQTVKHDHLPLSPALPLLHPYHLQPLATLTNAISFMLAGACSNASLRQATALVPSPLTLQYNEAVTAGRKRSLPSPLQISLLTKVKLFHGIFLLKSFFGNHEILRN